MHHGAHKSTPCIKRAESKTNNWHARAFMQITISHKQNTVLWSSSSISSKIQCTRFKRTLSQEVHNCSCHVSEFSLFIGAGYSLHQFSFYSGSFERTVWELICMRACKSVPVFKPKISALAIWSPQQTLERESITTQWQWIKNPTELKAGGNPKNYITTEKRQRKNCFIRNETNNRFGQKMLRRILNCIAKEWGKSIDCIIRELISYKEHQTRNNLSFGQCLERQKSTDKTEDYCPKQYKETLIYTKSCNIIYQQTSNALIRLCSSFFRIGAFTWQRFSRNGLMSKKQL